jgi:uncharacterized membrane protein
MCFIQFILTMILSFVVDIPYLYLNLNLFKKKTMAISGKPYPSNRLYSAVIVYIAIALGLVVFVLPKIDTTKTVSVRMRDSLMYGGLFGLVSYAIFDFTNHFMFEGWDIYVAMMDSIWGGLLCSIVSFIISYY